MSMTQLHNDFISKPEVSFWVPILTSCVIIAGSWFNLSGRIDLLAQKMDLLIQNQANTLTLMQAKDSDLETKYNQMQTQWGNLSQRVTKLER